ncbi:MAG: heat-inducible transcriptional repressor HrcA [Candidatus Promineifilaceae bacterium]
MFATLTDRQELILGLVVKAYIEHGEPIGSKTLVNEYGLDVSSATVRNELATLNDLGYLMQLHTSAGRIPTELGYRYFVQKLLGDFRLPLHERQMIQHQFHQARLDLGQWMKLAAATLARTSSGASLVTAPHLRPNRFKHLQLISTQGRLVLMILVLYGGEVYQQMLNLAEPLPQTRLTAVANRLNTLCYDLQHGEISARMSQFDFDTLEEEIAKLVMDLMIRADGLAFRDYYRDGLMNIVNDEGTRQAVRLLEERTLLHDVITETQPPEAGSVQVIIGGEGRWEELKDCTIILSRYGTAQNYSGTVAVIGPTRMPYGRNVAAVRYVSDLMSGFLDEYYLESSDQNGQLPEDSEQTGNIQSE